jgi:putative tryptophan/tyrosine transport system substrate-binding protein
MKRRAFITLMSGLAIAWSLACYAQPLPTPLKRVTLLSDIGCPIAPDNRGRRRLAELGWVEGRNFVLDCVSPISRLDQIPALARELVTRRPDVIIAGPWQYVTALKRETTTIPIVMLGAWEPVQLDLITSLARPEGNVTGVAWFGLFSKQLELLKEIFPDMRRVAVINASPRSPPEVIKIGTGLINAAANTLGLTWEAFGPAVANDYDEIFARLAAEHFDAAYIVGNPLNNQPQNMARIGQLALRHLIPTVGEQAAFARSGVLLSYGQDVLWTVVRVMDYVDKILRGAKPSDLPVEQATKFDLVINLKTAKTLGLTVPPSLLARADEVIE